MTHDPKAAQDAAQARLHDAYHALMLGYACGTLDQAQTLITAMHIAMSKNAQRILRDYESVGANFLERDCNPVDLCTSALDNVLERIEKAETQAKARTEQDDSPNTEHTLNARMCAEQLIAYALNECDKEHTICKSWKKVYPGFQSIDLNLCCKKSTARLIKAAPAKKPPRYNRNGIEITLILDGAYSDSTGIHTKGDLIVSEEYQKHSHKSCAENGCVYMVVSDAPIRLSGIAKLFSPFLKF